MFASIYVHPSFIHTHPKAMKRELAKRPKLKLPNGRRAASNRRQKWGAPFAHSVDLQLEIEALTHTTGFTFAELERMEANEDWAEFIAQQDA